MMQDSKLRKVAYLYIPNDRRREPKTGRKNMFNTYEYRDMLVAPRFSVGGRRKWKKDEEKTENEGKKIL